MLRTLIVVALLWTMVECRNTSLPFSAVAAVGRARGTHIFPTDDEITELLKEAGIRLEYQDEEEEEDRLLILDRIIKCRLIKYLVVAIRVGRISILATSYVLCKLGLKAYYKNIFAHHTEYCIQLAYAYWPAVKYVFEHSKILDREYAASVLLHEKLCYEYDLQVFKLRTPIKDPNKRVPEIDSKASTTPLKILHLGDLHVQFDYVPNTVRECYLPLCCRNESGTTAGGGGSGRWGDYKCDLPRDTLKDTLRKIKDEHGSFDLVYMLGDVIDHNFMHTRERVYEIMKEVLDAFAEYFPGAMVLPVVGNHDTVPVNLFPPPWPSIKKVGLDNNWLYDMFKQLWRRWLPDSALETVEKQGYYAVEINQKLKVISLNNNVAYKLNFWILLDVSFIGRQLIFLRDQLAASEKKGQFVHILAHIPVGGREAIETWERNYERLIRRYGHLIKGQFFGHTHLDELKLFYLNKTALYNVGYNSGALTPYQDYNPNYKIVFVDQRTYDIIDIDTYIFNLKLANEGSNEPKWFKSYSMKEAYGFEDFSYPSIHKSMLKVIKRMKLFSAYYKYAVSEGEPSLKKGCSFSCATKRICELYQIVSMRGICSNIKYDG